MHFNSEVDQGTQPLPSYWEMRVDPRTGLPYYLNHRDKFTTWDDPRVVDEPRGMLNTVGSMLQPNDSHRFRQSSVEPCSASDRFFTTPKNLQSNFFSQSLPRKPKSQHQPFFTRPFMNDWIREGFDDFDGNFYGPSWPFKSHTIQRPQQARAQSVQPTGSGFGPVSRQARSQDDMASRAQGSNDIVSENGSHNFDPRYQGEHYIIPTRYKRNNNKRMPSNSNSKANNSNSSDRAENQHTKSLDNEEDSRGRKVNDEHIADDSNEDAILKRMNSVQSQNMSDDEDENVENKEEYRDGESVKVSSKPSPIKIVIEDHDNLSSGPNEQQSKNTESVGNNPAPSTERMECSEDSKTSPEEDDPIRPEDDPISKSYKAIEKVRKEVQGYKDEVEKFEESKASKQYRYLEEMLTRSQLALDNVETHGDIELRKTRKQTVNFIESILQQLESKASGST